MCHATAVVAGGGVGGGGDVVVDVLGGVVVGVVVVSHFQRIKQKGVESDSNSDGSCQCITLVLVLVLMLVLELMSDLPTHPYLTALVRKLAGNMDVRSYLSKQGHSFQKVRKSWREQSLEQRLEIGNSLFSSVLNDSFVVNPTANSTTCLCESWVMCGIMASTSAFLTCQQC